MDDIPGGSRDIKAHGWPVMHGFWLAIALLTGSLGLVSGISIGVHSGAETAEIKIAEACRQAGAFTVKRSAFECARMGKD